VRLLRIVPDDTKFDFMRFRRISSPVSALLSIAAILLYFFHGLNFGIDFVGGTLMEVQAKAGPADLAKMRSTIGGLHLGDFQLQQFGAPNDVLIRISQQPGGDAAQQEAVQKVRKALGEDVDYRRVEVVGPSVSTELLSYGTIGLVLAIGAILILILIVLSLEAVTLAETKCLAQRSGDAEVARPLRDHAVRVKLG